MNHELNKGIAASELEEKDTLHEPLLGLLDLEISAELVKIISALRAMLVSPEQDPDTLRQLWGDYLLQFQALGEQANTTRMHFKVDIGASLYKALIFRDTGRELRYLEELNVAEICAEGSGLHDLMAAIAAEIDTKVENLEPSPERLILQLRGKVRNTDQELLWSVWAQEQDYEALVSLIPGMLLNNDKDPAEVLGKLGIEIS